MTHAPLLPRHVLMTADAVGGVWSYALTLAGALRAAGCGVTLAVMGRALSAAQQAQADAIAGLDLRVRPLRLEWMEDCWADVAEAGEWLASIAREIDPDVVHLNQFAFGAQRWSAPVVIVGHSCVSSWWEAVHGVRAPASWSRYREVVREGLQGADLVVAPSHAMLASLREHYGPFSHGRVVPNACVPSSRAVAKEPMVFAAGRVWDAAKNLVALDGAAAQIEWPVVVAGDVTPPPGALGGHGLPRLRTLGPLEAGEVRRWMARAAIYALPARYEPFGLSVLEAAAEGCALVLGDIPSLRENWDGAAVFVDPRSPSNIGTALQRLTADAAERARLSAAARSRATRFTPGRFLAAYLDCYAAASGFRRRARETASS